jgi:hypothetical protein
MVECHNAKYCSLHVRETNFAAYHLYKDTLKFDVHGTEDKYYADGENAFDMRKPLSREMFNLRPLPSTALIAEAAKAVSGAGVPSTATATTDSAKDAAAKRRRKGPDAPPMAETPAVVAGASDSGSAVDVDALAAEIEAMSVEPVLKDLKASEGKSSDGKKSKKKK